MAVTIGEPPAGVDRLGTREEGSRMPAPHHTARLLPGAPVAERAFTDVRARVRALRERGVTPSLATILVGDDDASAGYIRIKQRKAAELGFDSPHSHLPAAATQDDLEDIIGRYNDDPAVHGMLVQYPVPAHLDYDAALSAIDPAKDVDGMHPLNLGKLAAGIPGPLPCTPAGIEELLAFHEIPVAGRHVVILGRGATLGRPLAMLLAQKRPTANAAVTVVHTGVPDWSRYTREADILVAAAGVPGIVQPEHVRPGGVVIGGGVRYEGRRLLPDVDERCAEVAGAITPRVGGVGPTTVAMLFRNVVTAAERQAGAQATAT
jgi:methylenetetrahydrofolate dehydrogenase (NADP+)/methenyltetrahydrofolate cyclohydrolase